jgi:hypothetical protein
LLKTLVAHADGTSVADANLFPDEASFSPRPAWQVIEAARRRYLTGELTLPTTPATKIYLRDGMIYFAERTSDGALPIRLMVEGVITREQMQRGTVIVNGVEHVGRLFDSDSTIDRASVELCVELFTDDVMISVANTTVTGYELVLYRRHPSGIDRWYPHSIPVTGRTEAAPATAATTTHVTNGSSAPKAVATPKQKQEAAPAPEPAQAAQAPAPVQARVEAKVEPKNRLNAPPITQAVPVTPPAGSTPAPPPPPITQTVPTIGPITTQMPVTSMPAPTAQIPVTSPAAAHASAELDAAVIADEVAEAIKRAFAGMGAGS